MALDLSQKRHYTFPQLVSRLQCSAEDLRYFVMERELTPSSYIGSGHYRAYQMHPHEDYGTTGHVFPSPVFDASHPNEANDRGWLSGFHYLVLPNRTDANHCEFRYAAKFSLGFDIGDIIYELEATIDIDEVMTKGFVMAVELDRFVASRSLHQTPRTSQEVSVESTIDPSDFPAELDAANLAFRAVTNGYGDKAATVRNRLIDYLRTHHPGFKQEQLQRIATVANPDKTTGRKKSD